MCPCRKANYCLSILSRIISQHLVDVMLCRWKVAHDFAFAILHMSLNTSKGLVVLATTFALVLIVRPVKMTHVVRSHVTSKRKLLVASLELAHQSIMRLILLIDVSLEEFRRISRLRAIIANNYSLRLRRFECLHLILFLA